MWDRTREKETKTQVKLKMGSQVLALPDRNSVHSPYHTIRAHYFPLLLKRFKILALFNRYFNRKVSKHFKYE